MWKKFEENIQMNFDIYLKKILSWLYYTTVTQEILK